MQTVSLESTSLKSLIPRINNSKKVDRLDNTPTPTLELSKRLVAVIQQITLIYVPVNTGEKKLHK